MFKAGDPLNPYDPASMDGAYDPFDRIRAGTSPMNAPRMAEMLKDPSTLARLTEMIKADAAEAKARGETPEQFARREKMEWAAQDAHSARLKTHGNDAFKKGDYERAFVIYSLCVEKSGHDPVYHLNRAAASLKLRLFEQADEDCTESLSRNISPKTYYRRAQARRLYGNLLGAREDLVKAKKLAPNDALVAAEEDELKRVEALEPDALKKWVKEQGGRQTEDLFTEEAITAKAKEIADEIP